MICLQEDMKIPSSLIPYCPHCGAPMTMNLRCDDTFVQDTGWYQARDNYQQFIKQHQRKTVLYLELGVGQNTPVIIKYPFWQYTYQNKKATYACINLQDSSCPREIRKRSILINHDIHHVIEDVLKEVTL